MTPDHTAPRPQKGDRVRLSAHGKSQLYPDKPHKQSREGVCVRAATYIAVLWDDLKTAQSYGANIIERIPQEERSDV